MQTITEFPADSLEGKLQHQRYLTLRLERAEEEFNSTRQRFMEQANSALHAPSACPPPPDDCVEVTRRLLDVVNKLRAKKAAIDAEIAAIRPQLDGGWLARQGVERHEQEIRQRSSELFRSLQDITE